MLISLCNEPSQPHRVKMMSGETGRADKPLPSEHFLEIGIFPSFFFPLGTNGTCPLRTKTSSLEMGNSKYCRLVKGTHDAEHYTKQ